MREFSGWMSYYCALLSSGGCVTVTNLVFSPSRAGMLCAACRSRRSLLFRLTSGTSTFAINVAVRLPASHELRRVIAVVQLINKIRPDAAGGSARMDCRSGAGQHFTEQDATVIGTFLGLLGPHILTSSTFRSQRTMTIKVKRFTAISPCFDCYLAQNARRTMKDERRK